MADDPRKAETLEEACANGDGTYNGARLLSWLSAAVTGGKGISVEEAEHLWRDAKAKAEQKKGHV